MSDDETAQSDRTGICSNEQYDFLGKHMETYNVETSAVHRKLQSKIEALRILRQELDKFRIERDQYKLMAETLQLRYSALKRSSNDMSGGISILNENKSSVAALLHETRERNLKLNTEVESLKQKLYELQGDIELLRDKESTSSALKQRLKNENQDASNVTCSREELQWKLERANFICHLENLKKKNAQLAFDFKALIDEKEEIVTERDAFKCKAHRLNHELFVALKANAAHPKFLDIDGILLENKYLHERLKHTESELELTQQTTNKYKAILETKRKKGIIKLGTSSNEENILSPRQVKTMLDNGIDLPTKTETVHDLKSLCLLLLDNLNDKNLALSHQKKTNKILATKIAELEQRLQSLAGLDTSSTDDFGYAPSQLLLNGYCPSMVDINDSNKENVQHTAKEQTCTEDSGTINSEPDECAKATVGTGGCTVVGSDDGMSSLSTESGRSILSSEYGIDVCLSDFVNNAMELYKSSSATTDSGNCGSGAVNHQTAYISSTIARERQKDLQGLPAHLAALVEKALHELDMRDFDEKIVSRTQRTPLQDAEEQSHSVVAEEALEYDI